MLNLKIEEPKTVSEYYEVLNRWKSILSTEIESINHYKRTLNTETQLSHKGKAKMRILLENMLIKAEDLLNEVSLEQKRCIGRRYETSPQQMEAKFSILFERFQGVQLRIEKITATTPKLEEIKSRMEKKIKFYDEFNTEKHKKFVENTYATAGRGKSKSRSPAAPKFEEEYAKGRATYLGAEEESTTSFGGKGTTLRYEKYQRYSKPEFRPTRKEKDNTSNSLYSKKKQPSMNEVSEINEEWVDSMLKDIEKKEKSVPEFQSFTRGLSRKKGSLPSTVGVTRARTPTGRPKPTDASSPTESRLKTEVKDPLLGNSEKAYARGFKLLAQEFQGLKDIIRKLKSEYHDHKHYDLETNIEKYCTEAVKIESDNKIIHREHSEMLHSIHILTKRVSTLEKENHELRNNLAQLTHEVHFELDRPIKSSARAGDDYSLGSTHQTLVLGGGAGSRNPTGITDRISSASPKYRSPIMVTHADGRHSHTRTAERVYTTGYTPNSNRTNPPNTGAALTPHQPNYLTEKRTPDRQTYHRDDLGEEEEGRYLQGNDRKDKLGLSPWVLERMKK